jgi:hypothetical protein
MSVYINSLNRVTDVYVFIMYQLISRIGYALILILEKTL